MGCVSGHVGCVSGHVSCVSGHVGCVSGHVSYVRGPHPSMNTVELYDCPLLVRLTTCIVWLHL